MPEPISLQTSGLYVTADGDVVSTLRVSPSRNLFLGSNKLVYHVSGQVVRHRKRAAIDLSDIVSDATALIPGACSLSMDTEWGIVRRLFVADRAYPGLVEIAEGDGLSLTTLAYFADRFLAKAEHQRFARHRHSLVMAFAHLTEISHDA